MKRVTIYVDENDWVSVKDTAYLNRVSCGKLLMDLYGDKYPKTKGQPSIEKKKVVLKESSVKEEITPRERYLEWKKGVLNG